MRSRRLRRADLAIVLLLALGAAWPFLSRPGLPFETDAELHVFRLAELARLVSAGELYPRWAPNFYFGYGYPIFNYYAPLTYYLGLPFALVPALGAVMGIKFVFVFTYVVAATGLYGFVFDWWGRGAAMVAAASYLYAPYLHYVDPHARGDAAEFLSFGLFPLALWALSRLSQRPRRLSFTIAVLSTAAVILSHNLMALVFFALLALWLLWQAALAGRMNGRPFEGMGRIEWFRQRGWYLLLALGLGVLVAAFFWLPVALEQHAVNLITLIGDGSHFDYRNHFRSMTDLLGPTSWLDWGATEPEFTLNLGPAQWLLGLLGVAGIVTGYARARRQALFFALSAFVLLFLMSTASTFVWQTVPLMPYLQFPWRLLGPAAAMLAIVGGVGVQALSTLLGKLAARPDDGSSAETARRARIAALATRWVAPLALLIILLQSLPTGMPPPWPGAAWDTSAAVVTAIERQGRWLGTTSTADFVPRTVEVLPRPQREMVEQLLAGQTPDRVNRATMPEGATVQQEAIRPLHLRYQISSDEPFLLRLFLFDFPGWEARVNGEKVQTSLGRPEGFLVAPLPAGDHVVDVQFQDTAARKLAWLATIAGVIGTVIAAASLAAQRRVREVPRRESTSAPVAVSARGTLPLLLVGAVFVGVYALAHWQSLFHFRSQGWTAIPAQVDMVADLGGQLSLIGFDAPSVVRRGDDLEVTLYWKAQTEMDINFQVFVHLLDSAGAPASQSDKLNPGNFPTRRWPTDKYVRDSHRLPIPDTLAPGRYLLSTGMWVQAEGWRLPLLDSAGEQVGDSISLLEIEVR